MSKLCFGDRVAVLNDFLYTTFFTNTKGVSILGSQEDRGQRFAFRAQLWLDDSLPG